MWAGEHWARLSGGPAWSPPSKERRRFAVELLYSDHEGGQRTISLFSVIPRGNPDNLNQWMCSVGRHWNIDRPDPR